MYTPMRDEPKGINIKINFEPNTAKGFCYSLALCLLLSLISSQVKVKPPTSVLTNEVSRIPIEIISFGAGDGTGMSKGNLTEEGTLHKGALPQSIFSNAEVAGKTANNKSGGIPDNPEDASSFTPVADAATTSETGNGNTKGGSSNGIAGGTGSRNIGSPNGSLTGTGLGGRGFGKGAGLGLGNIEWGGGGNRTVLSHREPAFPSGSRGGSVKIRFTVDKNGTVISARPVTRGGDPALESAALRAIRSWRFNSIGENKNMEGVITFIFKLK